MVRGDELEPVGLELAVPGEHNRRNAAVALAALELAGVPRADAERVLPEFRGAGRRFEPRGEAGGVRVFDDYGHNPSKIAATLEAAGEVAAGGRVLVLFQPHLYSRTRHLAAELGAALAAADIVAVSEVYAAREEPLPGVGGQARRGCARRASGRECRSHGRRGWKTAARFLSRRARPGDIVLTIGAGDVDRAAPLILEALS